MAFLQDVDDVQKLELEKGFVFLYFPITLMQSNIHYLKAFEYQKTILDLTFYLKKISKWCINNEPKHNC